MIDQSACTKKATVASGNVLTLSRRRYCHGHGGKPDLIWLLTVLPTLLRERGDSHDITERILTHNHGGLLGSRQFRRMSSHATSDRSSFLSFSR